MVYQSQGNVPQGIPNGLALLQDPALNKGTAFTEKERNALGLRGLLPPHVHSQEEQATRVMTNLRKLADPLETSASPRHNEFNSQRKDVT